MRDRDGEKSFLVILITSILGLFALAVLIVTSSCTTVHIDPTCTCNDSVSRPACCVKQPPVTDGSHRK